MGKDFESNSERTRFEVFRARLFDACENVRETCKGRALRIETDGVPAGENGEVLLSVCSKDLNLGGVLPEVAFHIWFCQEKYAGHRLFSMACYDPSLPAIRYNFDNEDRLFESFKKKALAWFGNAG